MSIRARVGEMEIGIGRVGGRVTEVYFHQSVNAGFTSIDDFHFIQNQGFARLENNEVTIIAGIITSALFNVEVEVSVKIISTPTRLLAKFAIRESLEAKFAIKESLEAKSNDKISMLANWRKYDGKN